ncbi:hypothetical protein KYK29_14135 [Shinella daejeonensis]|uniref:acyl carrier protein n=1 Tax=Shinella daejeonensis TaxID=659017 RepID=UPI0020C77F32|nr:phosphopantetheine-binding protein [Shinella daejeonensis]MCP8896066.1 hypothetical protein [Shinella daejeonensis]
MVKPARTDIRDFVLSILSTRGVSSVGEHERLFSSGRLDSLAATEVLILLETDYGVDLADENFDILQIDTLHDLEKLVSSGAAASSGAGSPGR